MEEENLELLAGELGRRIAELVWSAQRQLEAEVAESRSRIATLERVVEQLDAKLSDLLGERTRQRVDLTTSDDMVHHEIAKDFRALVDHRLQALARDEARRARRQQSVNVAWLMCHLCHALFAGDDADDARVRDLLRDSARHSPHPVQELCDEAGRLRLAAGSARLPGHWDFDFQPDCRPDPERQEPWASCDPALPARFVVSPAYAVGDRLFCLQRVYTAALADAPGQE